MMRAGGSSLPALLGLLLLATAPGALRAERKLVLDAGDLPEHRVDDPDASVVTEANLLASERFWPYHLGLSRSFQPEGREQPLALGTSGVLIRIGEDGFARVDFGRDGLYEVPVGATDVVERANRVRRGELEKMAPNYMLAIGPRLVDAQADPPRGYSFRQVSEQRGFVSVFADPQAEGFEELAAALAPLRERAGVLVLLFPQGERRDADVYERLRALDWPVPFVHDHLTAPYTRTLLPSGVQPPAVLVQTPEGRLVYQRALSPGIASELLAAVDAAFPVETARKQP